MHVTLLLVDHGRGSQKLYINLVGVSKDTLFYLKSDTLILFVYCSYIGMLKILWEYQICYAINEVKVNNFSNNISILTNPLHI